MMDGDVGGLGQDDCAWQGGGFVHELLAYLHSVIHPLPTGPQPATPLPLRESALGLPRRTAFCRCGSLQRITCRT